MGSKRTCPSCGSSHLEPGNIQSTGRVYFRPENTKFLTLSTNDVPLVGNLCMDCGYVMLVAENLHKARKLLDQAGPH